MLFIKKKNSKLFYIRSESKKVKNDEPTTLFKKASLSVHLLVHASQEINFAVSTKVVLIKVVVSKLGQNPQQQLGSYR